MSKPNKYDVTDSITITRSTEELESFIKNAKEYELPDKMIENVNEILVQEPEFREFPQFQGVLPLDKLTPALNKFVEMTKDLSDAPDEFNVSSLLALWAGVVGNKLIGPIGLRPNVNIILFARSSEIRKSSSIKIAGKAFFEVQDELDKEAVNEEKKYLILPSDFSDAGFIEMMKNNTVSGIIVTGEYADYHKKLHREYTSMADAMLMAYDNDRMVRQTRGHGMEVVDNPTFSLLGATTFGNFRKVFSDTETENGTMQRLLAVALTKPTKARKLFLERKDMDEHYLSKLKEQILNWLSYSSLTVSMRNVVKMTYNQWETEFITSSKLKYGEKIIPHVERLVPACLKLAMLCESFETKDPNDLTLFEISEASLSCAISMIEELFFPSIAYLLKYEVVMSKVQYNQKRIEKELKSNSGSMKHSALLKKIRIKPKDLKEAIENLHQNQYIKIQTADSLRPQGGGNASTLYKWIAGDTP